MIAMVLSEVLLYNTSWYELDWDLRVGGVVTYRLIVMEW